MFVVFDTPAVLRQAFYACFAMTGLAFQWCYCLERRAGFPWEGTSDGAARRAQLRRLAAPLRRQIERSSLALMVAEYALFVIAALAVDAGL
mmetsp:Transcript_9575/g.35099  ORF Transcript_9575/g.35099 Transcript_9575/m.35099 type:complete len:91 (-) Transcript_9575:40-312(-)